jgi:2-amino-4-hydroxy-6-hydroxymethyldihydropteridine diphosphokinase
MNTTYLIFGSNLGDRLKLIEEATQLVEKNIGRISKKSSMYDTEPWGFVHENTFLNQVICVETNLTPHGLLGATKKIESSLGRIREKVQYTARTIDIDILLYNDLVLKTDDLQIPHPKMAERRFVLEPLIEIAANQEHPILKKTIRQLLDECKDEMKVKRIS